LSWYFPRPVTVSTSSSSPHSDTRSSFIRSSICLDLDLRQANLSLLRFLSEIGMLFKYHRV
jgi:hypothetical protein